jgi:hypothetical protein
VGGRDEGGGGCRTADTDRSVRVVLKSNPTKEGRRDLRTPGAQQELLGGYKQALFPSSSCS